MEYLHIPLLYAEACFCSCISSSSSSFKEASVINAMDAVRTSNDGSAIEHIIIPRISTFSFSVSPADPASPAVDDDDDDDDTFTTKLFHAFGITLETTVHI